MSPEARSDLIASGVFGGVFVAAALAVGVLVLASHTDPAPEPSPGINVPVGGPGISDPPPDRQHPASRAASPSANAYLQAKH